MESLLSTKGILLPVPDEIRLGAWIDTYSGRRFHPFQPQPGDIDIRDIAHGLAMARWACRFRGQCQMHYTVAQHSVEVAHLIMRAGGPGYEALVGLLHDASEAYLPDLPGPIKFCLPEYRELERVIQGAIYTYFLGEEPAPWVLARVKEADQTMLATEAHLLMPRARIEDWDNLRGVSPLKDWRGPIPAERAEREFLELFEELQDHGLRGRG